MVKTFNYVNLDKKPINFEGKNVVIWGRGVKAISTFLDLKNKRINILGFCDSFSKDGDIFAGCHVISKSRLNHIENLVIYIAVNNESIKREILYMIESMELRDAIVVTHGLIYGAWEYDTQYFRQIIGDNEERIRFIENTLNDKESVIAYRNLVSYRKNNDRKMLEEIYETSHPQYFPADGLLEEVPSEVFIDAGGFDGLTTVEFASWAGNRFKKSIIFEADDTMYEICNEMMRIKHIDNARVIKKAVWSKEAFLEFDSTNYVFGSGNVVDYGGTCKVEAVTIDKTLEEYEEKATFIKMDIEGAEMEALFGAEKTIEKYHPKLAISIYHKDCDLWEIPFYLMKKYPFYKYYIRHYTPYTTETILYATK